MLMHYWFQLSLLPAVVLALLPEEAASTHSVVWQRHPISETARTYAAASGTHGAGIKYVHVLGERHSGTNYMTKMLEMNLPRELYHVTDYFIDYKHNVQYPPSDNPNQFAENLVIVMLRNPYDWAFAMGVHCWCGLVSYTNPMPFEEFISHEFTPQEASAFASFWRYGSSLSPPTIMDIRSAKISAFLNISRWAPNVEYVRLETVTRPDDALHWLSGLVSKYSLETTSPELMHYAFYKDHTGTNFEIEEELSKSVWFNRDLLDDDTIKGMVRAVNKHLVPATELMLGYAPIKA